MDSQLATWATHNYECPDGADLNHVTIPAEGWWCEKEDVKHGREVWRHKNLLKAAEIFWVKGKKHKLEQWWTHKGFKHLQISWLFGDKHGLEIRWTQKGSLGQATCFIANEEIWSTNNVVEAQTRTCAYVPEKAYEPPESEGDSSHGPDEEVPPVGVDP